MEKKMLFIFNPKAGKGKIKANLLDIVDIFNKGGYEVIIYSTQKSRDAYEKAKEYHDKSCYQAISHCDCYRNPSRPLSKSADPQNPGFC